MRLAGPEKEGYARAADARGQVPRRGWSAGGAASRYETFHENLLAGGTLTGHRRIVLHIGLPKTGTTTIQNALYANRAFLLEREGVLYPSLAPNLTTALCTVFKDDPGSYITNKIAGFSEEEIAARQRDYLSSLETELSSVGWDTLLLSAEGLSNLSASEMAKLRDWGEGYSSGWTVLVCVRHPVAYVRSVIQQIVKGGDTLERLYQDLPLPAFRRRISNAISAFGRENVRVFDFDAAVRGDGVVGTFAGEAGISAPSRDRLSPPATPATRENESLSLEAVRILDSLNRQRPVFVDNVRAPGRAEPGHDLAYLSRVKGRRFDLPGWVKEEIRASSREDVAWLNRTFGLDLYRDLIESAPPTRGHEEHAQVLSDPTVDSLAEVVGELVAEAVFHRRLDAGRAALARGDLERAARLSREAARLDPDAPQPKELLERVDTARLGTSAGAP